MPFVRNLREWAQRDEFAVPLQRYAARAALTMPLLLYKQLPGANTQSSRECRTEGKLKFGR